MYGSDSRWSQLERGPLQSSSRSVRVGPMRIFRERVSVGSQRFGRLQPGTVILGTVASSATRARWFGMPVTANDVAVGYEGIDICSKGPGELLAVLLGTEAVAEYLPELAGEEPSAATCLIRSPRNAECLRAILAGLFDPGPRDDAKETLLALLRQTLQGHRILPGSAFGRFQAVRLCDAYMRRHIDESISLQDLSDACGFRPRSLINAFEAFMGTTPMAYLKSQRLNGVRKALKRNGARHRRIIDIAMDWGFEHMGHFAADYRAMFGERPSETARAIPSRMG